MALVKYGIIFNNFDNCRNSDKFTINFNGEIRNNSDENLDYTDQFLNMYVNMKSILIF